MRCRVCFSPAQEHTAFIYGAACRLHRHFRIRNMVSHSTPNVVPFVGVAVLHSLIVPFPCARLLLHHLLVIILCLLLLSPSSLVAQVAPRALQEAPKWPDGGPIGSQDGPKRAQ